MKYFFTIPFFVFASATFAENELYEETDLPISPIEVGKPQKLELHPAKFTLSGPRSHMQLMLTGHYADGSSADLTRAATFTVSNQAIAKVHQHGTVTGLANGTSQIKVSSGGAQATMELTVQGIQEAAPVSFLHETLPVLSKAGCSMGACHGAPNGKGGFRLSLRAFDPTLDYKTIVDEEFGRRINLLEPRNSLLLAKPLNEIAHEGGQRLKDGDFEKETLLNWIQEGCQVDKDPAKCTGIRISPANGAFLRRPHHVQQFRVEADFSDGSIKDVTHLAVFESSDEKVCKVSRHGLAVGLQRGEAAVIVRYLEHIESALLGFVEDVPGFEWKAPDPANYVDEHVYAKLQQFQYLPGQLCSDEVFLRRVYLDVTGLLPPPEVATQFLRDKSPGKRA